MMFDELPSNCFVSAGLGEPAESPNSSCSPYCFPFDLCALKIQMHPSFSYSLYILMDVCVVCFTNLFLCEYVFYGLSFKF